MSLELLSQKAFVKIEELQLLTSLKERQALPSQLIKELRMVQEIDLLLSVLTSRILSLLAVQIVSHKGDAYAPEISQGIEAMSEGVELYRKAVENLIGLLSTLQEETGGQGNASEGDEYLS